MEKLYDDEKRKNIKFIVCLMCIGSFVEWFDISCYLLIASSVSANFFSNNDLSYWFATFSFGMIIRPIFAIAWGYLGDRKGRRYCSFASLLLTGFSCLFFSLLPPKMMVGDIIAPILLTLCRMLNGLSVAGEYPGAILYVGENAPREMIGYYTSFINMSASFGIIIVIGSILFLQSVLGMDIFILYGWRIIYACGSILIFVAYGLKLYLRESPLFKTLYLNNKIVNYPVKDLFSCASIRSVLVPCFGGGTAAASSTSASTYLALVFMQTQANIPNHDALLIIMVAYFLHLPFLICFGYLSDKHGRKPFILGGAILCLLFIFPVYVGLRYYGIHYNPYLLCLFLFVLNVLQACITAPIGALLIEIFPTHYRYTGFAFCYNFGLGFIVGLVPILGHAAEMLTNNGVYAALYFPVALLIQSIIVISFFMKETRGNEILKSDSLKMIDSKSSLPISNTNFSSSFTTSSNSVSTKSFATISGYSLTSRFGESNDFLLSSQETEDNLLKNTTTTCI